MSKGDGIWGMLLTRVQATECVEECVHAKLLQSCPVLLRPHGL